MMEAILSAIVDGVFGYVTEKGGDQFKDWALEKLGRDPRKQAFQEALKEAFETLKQKYPAWVLANFDASFFQHEGKDVLAQFLFLDGHPDPSELADRWAGSLNIQQSERRAFYVRELEPIASFFLESFAHHLLRQEAFQPLHDSRALQQLGQDVWAIRHSLAEEKASYGTRRDYLRWLIDRNLYLDPRGTYQTQRQVQVNLNEVYISLKAQREETPRTADRLFLERELAHLEEKYVTQSITAEEKEDQQECLFARFEKQLPALSEKRDEILELAECVQRSDCVVILGDPGSGKTTLLRYLTLMHAQVLRDHQTEAGKELGKARFPILIRIAEYAEEGWWRKIALSQFLAEACCLHECPGSGLADLLEKELEEGECLILLDGLDEIVSADERRGVVQQIEHFVRRYNHKGNRFVITSRIAGYRSAPLSTSVSHNGPFTHYTVCEMDEEQIDRFLKRWCVAVEVAQTPDLSKQERERVAQREIDGIVRAVKTSPGVRRLAANPLLLRILALIHRTGAQIPQKRIELYKLAAETLTRTWRPAQGVPESALVKEEYLTPLLSTLAYWLHVQKPSGIATEREVYEVLGEEWARLNDLKWDAESPRPQIKEEVRKFLVAVREHTGIFVERAPKRYGFMHLTFEEYYVARYLVARSRTRAKLIRTHLHDPRWQEPILLALGFVGLEYQIEASELVETAILAQGKEARALSLKPSKHEELLGRDYLFALRCLGDLIPIRPKLLKQLMDRFADEQLHQTGAMQYQRYQQAFTEMFPHVVGSEGSPYLHSLFFEALTDEHADVRLTAAQSLSWFARTSPETVTALLKTLTDEHADVRLTAAQSLSWLTEPAPEVVAALLKTLTDEHADVRLYAVIGLGRLAVTSQEGVTALLKTLTDEHADVRLTAAEILGWLTEPAPEVVTALLKTLTDEHADVRLTAAQSLSWFARTSPEVVTALLKALTDEHANVRCSAAMGLGNLTEPAPEVVTALLKALTDEHADVRLYAVIGLDRLVRTSPEVVAALLKALTDEHADVRCSAVMGLEELAETSPEVVTALLKALNGEDADVRRSAASGLGRLVRTSPEVVAALLKALTDEHADVRCSAVMGLGQLAEPSQEIVIALLKALTDENADVRSNAAISLGKFECFPSEGTSILIEGLQKGEIWATRCDCAKLLGRALREDAASLKALWHGFLDKDNNVRTACGRSLAQLGRRFPPLAKRLEKRFVNAIHNPKFEHHPASDYVYDALWFLVSGEKEE